MSGKESVCQTCVTEQGSLVTKDSRHLVQDVKIVAVDQFGSEMTITISRLAPIERMLANFEIILAHFHYGDYELDFKLKSVVGSNDAQGCADSE